MADIVSKQTRSRMMSGIRARNTGPEIIVRKLLHRQGFRFRLHVKDLPGKPDIVLPRYHAVIFVHGCFWHGHDCHLFRTPETRKEFWEDKIAGNRARDGKVIAELREIGRRVYIVWECAFRGKEKLVYKDAVARISDWLESDQPIGEIRGEVSAMTHGARIK